MRQFYTLEEIRSLAIGAYCEGYCAVYDGDDIDLDNKTEVDFLINKYIETRSKNERQFHILS